MIVNYSSFRQEQVFVFFTEINTITNEAGQNKSRYREKRVIVMEGGRVFVQTYCVMFGNTLACLLSSFTLTTTF